MGKSVVPVEVGLLPVIAAQPKSSAIETDESQQKVTTFLTL